MPPTRSDRKRIVRDDEDLQTNGSPPPSSPINGSAGATAMSRRGTASSSASSPKNPQTRPSPASNPQQHPTQMQIQMAQLHHNRLVSYFQITNEHLVQHFQTLNEQQKTFIAGRPPDEQRRMLEQQVARLMFQKLPPAEQARFRTQVPGTAQARAQAEAQARAAQLGQGFHFAETPEAILKKFESEPPSLILHIHPSHFRFGNQETVIPKNSPQMKVSFCS